MAQFIERLHVSAVHKFIPVDPTGLMDPEPDEIDGVADTVEAGEEQTLEDVGDVTQVEDIVKAYGCRE